MLERYRYTIVDGRDPRHRAARGCRGSARQVNGAYLEIHAGSITFQPAELAKVAIVIFLASYLHDNRQILVTAGRRVLGLTIPPMKQFGPMLIVWGAAMATLLLTRELGTSLMFYGAFLALLYVATGRFSFPFIGLVLFAVGAWFVAVHVSHVHARVLAWEEPFNPSLYKRTVGGSYQLAQSLFAQADGGLLGTGFDRSLLREAHGNSILPVPESDMIYAVIVNELGLAGAIALLLVYLLLVARGLSIAVMARDSFSKLLATGLSFVLALQVFVIVGGVTRVIPLTGVTLPFVAYGGSSVVMNFVLVALLLVISDRARRPQSAYGRTWSRRPPRRRGRRGAVEVLLDVTMPITRNPGGWEATLARLRRALEDDLFVLHFQPIVSLSDRTVARHEALLRLADGDDGRLVGPGEFLPAAERHGLIGEIDRWVLERVISLLAGHDGAALAAGGVAANISALSVSDPRLAGELERMFDRHGVEPSMLVLEITETAAIPDLGRARSFCAAMLELGCEIALDDFGAGYGGLHLLRELPFSYLKIDGEFIRRLPHLPRRPADRGRAEGALAGDGQRDGGRVRRRPPDDRDPAGHRRGAGSGLRARAPGAAAGSRRLARLPGSPGGVGCPAMSTTTAAPTLPDALGDARARLPLKAPAPGDRRRAPRGRRRAHLRDPRPGHRPRDRRGAPRRCRGRGARRRRRPRRRSPTGPGRRCPPPAASS